MNKIVLIIVLVFVAIGCKSPEARKPVKITSGSHIEESVERNKKWIAEEEAYINLIIAADTVHQYHISEKGFWYYYINELPDVTKYADFGDIIKYTYDIKDLNGNTLYSESELGLQTYHMDKEELITGLREGLKIMKEGETVTFVFPSYKAYGYYGDSRKIGSNTPIVSTITILNIEQIN